MPKVTKAMLEQSNAYLRSLLEQKAHEIELLEREIKTYQLIVRHLNVMTISCERLGAALAETINLNKTEK